MNIILGIYLIGFTEHWFVGLLVLLLLTDN